MSTKAALAKRGKRRPFCPPPRPDAELIGELRKLCALCRAGRLLEVQDWIRQGKPIALPKDAHHTRWMFNPLRVALETGIHSLVQILIEAGAPLTQPQTHGQWNALRQAVTDYWPDACEMLLHHGADASSVPMRLVFAMRDRWTVDLFVKHGASLAKAQPIGWSLIHKIQQPALGIVRDMGADPAVMRQAEIALRYHAREGSEKWVALLLWAGADPESMGPSHIFGHDLADDDDMEGPDDQSAIDLAHEKVKQRLLKAAAGLREAEPEWMREARLHGWGPLEPE